MENGEVDNTMQECIVPNEDSIIPQNVVQSEEKTLESSDISQENEESVDLGTFKNVQSLKSAYDELRASFTRKTQELAELKKNNSDKVAVAQTPEYKKVWEREDWQERVDKFFIQNPQAQSSASEIAKILVQNKDIANSDTPLQNAWISILSAKGDIADKLQDDDFVDSNIVNNDKIKDKIIKNYLSTLQKQNTPQVIAGQSSVLGVSSNKPNTLTEAREYVKKIFSK